MTEGTCLFCQLPANVDGHPTHDRYIVYCPNCGKFEISRSAYEDNAEKLSQTEAAILSHIVFKMHKLGDPVYVDNYLIQEKIKTEKIPSHSGQSENLIRFIGDKLGDEKSGQVVRASFGYFSAAMGSISEKDAAFIIQELEKHDMVVIGSRTIEQAGRKHIGVPAVGLTLNGWDRYAEILKIDSPEISDDVDLPIANNGDGQNADRVSQLAPAADRIVTLDHNRAEYIEMVDAVDAVIDAVAGDNEYGNDAPEEKEAIVGGLKSGRSLLNAVNVKVSAVQAILLSALNYVINNFTKGVLAALGATAVAVVGRIFGIF